MMFLHLAHSDFFKQVSLKLKSSLYFGPIAGSLCLFLLVLFFPVFEVIRTSNAQVNATSNAQVNATSNAQVNATFKTYQNLGFGLILTHPSNWSVEELRSDPDAPIDDDYGSIVVIFKTETQGENDRYQENVAINIQGPHSDLKSLRTYTRDSIQAFRGMPDIEITESVKDTLSGFPAHQLQYTSKLTVGAFQELNLKKMQVFTVVENVAYVVTYGSEHDQYDTYIQDMENLVNSIKIDRDAI